MQSSLQTIETGRVPLSHVLRRIRRHDYASTPGKLRVAQIVLALGVLLAGGVGFYSAIDLQSTTDDISGHLEPLNTNVTTLYQSLAGADATVTAGFLSGGGGPGALGGAYDKDVARAADSLTQAGTQINGDPVTESRIADITAQLPVYTGLVGQARANSQPGPAGGVGDLSRASGLMQSAILPKVAALQHRQAGLLHTAYQQTGTGPIVALAVGGLSLVGLIWAQVFLFRRTHRVFNIGLVVASGAMIVGLVWWTAALAGSSGFLTSSLGHSQALSDALGPAQIAALQARAAENLELVTAGDAAESDFATQMQLLEWNGTGGALGAAQQFAADQQGKELVQKAVRATDNYVQRHAEVRKMVADGDHAKAVDDVVSTHPGSAAQAFNGLVKALGDAVGYENNAFAQDIGRAQQWLTGLPIGTGALALTAVAGVVVGIQRRLEEYR